MSRVMFIDDDPMILRMAAFILKKSGHECIKALSGSEGLDIIRSQKPDLIFIDSEMPELSGIETLRIIKADSAVSDIGVYIMSGTITDELRSQAASLGALGVIEKPLRPDLINKLTGG